MKNTFKKINKAKNYQELIVIIKELPFVEKTKKVIGGIYIYGKENPGFGDYRKESFMPEPDFYKSNTLNYMQDLLISIIISAKPMYNTKAGKKMGLWF